MVNYCCVPLCNGFGGFHFPKDKYFKDLWRVAVKKGVHGNKMKLWEPSRHDVVCHRHFKPEDYRSTHSSERKRLKKGVVPTIFLERMSSNSDGMSELKEKLRQRAEKRQSRKAPVCTPLNMSIVQIPEIQQEIEVPSEMAPMEIPTIGKTNVAIQCDLLTDCEEHFSIEKIKNNAAAIKYYTGFDDYDHFMMFFTVLGPAVGHLNRKYKFKPCDQLFLTLIKLRQNKDDYELAFLFNTSKSSISRIVNTWINFMYFQLQEVNWWPSRSVTSTFMPEDFKRKFSSTRVILDATEVPIQKPSNVEAQSATFSTYKHKNTLKTMIGIAPRGNVTFVSCAYGGTASDRQIIERSSLCKKKLFENKDSIMADRGIMVQDLFATKNVTVNTPTMLSGKSQLEPETVVRDRRIASKRIHVERVIGLGKQFKILKSELPATRIKLGSRIVYVCYMLLNFRKCIVGKLA